MAAPGGGMHGQRGVAPCALLDYCNAARWLWWHSLLCLQPGQLRFPAAMAGSHSKWLEPIQQPACDDPSSASSSFIALRAICVQCARSTMGGVILHKQLHAHDVHIACMRLPTALRLLALARALRVSGQPRRGTMAGPVCDSAHSHSTMRACAHGMATPRSTCATEGPWQVNAKSPP